MFLYTNKEHKESKIKNILPFIIILNKVKYLYRYELKT